MKTYELDDRISDVSAEFLGSDARDVSGAPDVSHEWRIKIQLRPQQRLSCAAVSHRSTYVVREGVLAIDISAGGGQRQISDFLIPGDVIPLSAFLAPNTVSIRAITKASLMGPDEGTAPQVGKVADFREMLVSRLEEQLARSSINQIMIGIFDAEPRVATFLLVLAMRCCGGWHADRLLPLPMSRDDIADHLAMNRDTLSRIMMRFETLGIIVRVNRHAIRVVNFEKLKRLTTITTLISTTLNRQALVLQN